MATDFYYYYYYYYYYVLLLFNFSTIQILNKEVLTVCLSV